MTLKCGKNKRVAQDFQMSVAQGSLSKDDDNSSENVNEN